MNFNRLKGDVMILLAEDLKRLSHTVSDCPFYVHVKGLGSDAFRVCFSISKHEPFDGSSDILAHAVCTVLPDLYNGTVMLRVSVRETKKELGRREPKWDEHDWTRQDWRYEKFIVECSAAPLWNLLERSVDFEKVAARAVGDVVDA